MTASQASAQNDRRLDYCIPGTQKSATSTLSAVLTRHRLIQRSHRKELNYFANELRDWDSGDYSDFDLPPQPGGHYRLLGDATPLYMWWPQALERIQVYNPDMKLITIFRDPIERLFSQWVMIVNRWPRGGRGWPEFLVRYAPPGLEERIPAGVNLSGYRMNSGVVRGFYGAQLERAQALFGAEQVHTLEFRAFLADHTSALDGLTDFLGVHRYLKPPQLPHKMPGLPKVVGTAPVGRDIAGLVETYSEDFETFKKLSALDVSQWPLQRLLDGDLHPDELAAQYARKVIPPGD